MYVYLTCFQLRIYRKSLQILQGYPHKLYYYMVSPQLIHDFPTSNVGYPHSIVLPTLIRSFHRPFIHILQHTVSGVVSKPGLSQLSQMKGLHEYCIDSGTLINYLLFPLASPFVFYFSFLLNRKKTKNNRKYKLIPLSFDYKQYFNSPLF